MELSKVEGTMWAFLEGVKRAATPLPRFILVKFSKKHISVLSVLCEVTRSAIAHGCAAAPANPLLISGVDRVISFFTATIVEIVDSKGLEDVQLRALFPYLVDGLRGRVTESSVNLIPLPQWCRSCCIILSQISRSMSLAKPFIQGIVSGMFSRLVAEIKHSSRYEDSCVEDVVKGFVVFTQLQQVHLLT